MNIFKKKEELKKELDTINKKLRYKKCNEYQKRDENKEFCEYCNKKISKYAIDKAQSKQNTYFTTKNKRMRKSKINCLISII